MRHAMIACAIAAAAVLAGCADEQGQYQVGDNDPALKVTDGDIAQVEKALDAQDAKDRAAGIRTVAAAHGAAKPPAGHADFGSGEGPYAKKASAASASAPAPGGRVSIGEDLTARLPEGWRGETPASPMRVAQFAIPASAGDPEGGVIAVTFFPGGGGSVEANLERWYGQFTQPDGRESKSVAKTENFKANGLDVTFLDLAGTMKPSNMPGAPASPEHPGWRMLSAIVMTSNGPYFLKGTGPQKTMTENRDKMVEFLKSVAPPGVVPAAVASAPVASAPASAPAPPMPGPQAPPAAAASPMPAPPAPPAVPPSAPAAQPAMPAPQPPPAAAASAARIPIGEEFAAQLPEGWRPEQPASPMRLAQVAIPASAGDPENGVVAVTFFPGGGGTVEANLERWYGQFTQPDGRETRAVAKTETFKSAGGMEVTFVDIPGTMKPSNMPGAPASPEHAGWRMLSGIVMTASGPYFFKGSGPDKTMTENREKMAQFLKSVGPR